MNLPTRLSKITINGEEYWPTPHEVNPEVPEDQVWSQWPPNELYMSDPDWYDSMGQDLIVQRRIWAIQSESGQVDAFQKLLAEAPDHSLDMMWAAALKGKAHIIRFLLSQGIKPTAVKADGDDLSLVPLHVSAAQGHLDCVKVFVEEAQLPPDTPDDLGGTPLMRACFKKQPEVVRYLLGQGADLTIRQTSCEERNPGTNAFEFAAGSGCIACAKALLFKAQELEIDSSSLATPLALEAAAQSEEIDMLDLVLELGKYPRLDRNKFDEATMVALTDLRKDAIEAAFCRALSVGRWESLKTLLPYIESRNPENGDYNWRTLKDQTLHALMNGILTSVENDSEGNQALFVFLGDVFLHPSSRLLSPTLREQRDEILGDVFFWACRFGSLAMLRLLSAKYGKVDVNHLSHRVAPIMSSGLYIAAGGGHDEVVDYLFLEHGGIPNIHLGNGKFVNGTTPLWIAIWYGYNRTTRRLLSLAGPISELDDMIMEAKQTPSAIVITATATYRAPVKIYSRAKWAELYGEIDESKESNGKLQDLEGNQMAYLVMTIEGDDIEWWRKLEFRKSDEELTAMETNGRECKPAS
ncbi:hypothetical protein PFICI_10721 [Pestalotiopsis fici W106-1]|uniref:Uncharacterized protein n=1 Tax=Pestalotiopsis fici (strain W106-1 / CGMCC3.15140) TaxID=1229662 RepID=W3WUQ0_PESFW|nr:uncharacterized protein PFICI_10721 [Pestalotiopsis fici W106-1]ETS76847.1 hypothetical protein PFICI_10721 [Pestalotiopsis fici W106-1]